MRTVLAVLVLLLAATTVAQESASSEAKSPAIAVLSYHPYPDPSDPFGVEYLATGTDAYWHRYQYLDTDNNPGFDYPHAVFDGVAAIEGIPDGDGGPFVKVQQAYEAAFDGRAVLQQPIQLSVGTLVAGEQSVAIGVEASWQADLSGDDLRVWVAVVEDPVNYEPPQALSNGVFVHPFVVRTVRDLGPLGGFDGAPTFVPVLGDGPTAWDLDLIRAVAWVQNGPSDGLRFEAYEVVQAAMEVHQTDGLTVASEKVVLMEMYSATWCDPCLFGDRAAEELAQTHGVQRDLEPDSPGYLRDGPWVLAAVGGVMAAVAVALPRLPGGRS